ncbi:hypothetical protein AJ79_01990 [Helicocarpus griseus UAMH5409]|uniref:Nephrocystin 3-like N-terminal domain-containing protein n=1 Tax=Helicocarpus griseus UAMH5409 TaxID=1447875 RepID=A0A2B7Y445_9EURO|nr:hypothetical protein AJ79_01990 [Helicocarpus griseus UAMH5409]
MSDDEITSFESHCRDVEQRVDTKQRTASEISQLKPMLEEFKALKDLKDPIKRIETGLADMWKILNEDERGRILSWVSDAPYLDNHLIARTGRTEDTGGWLLEHESYRSWKSSDKSMILWLHGIPGAGKTKLTSRVIDSFDGRGDCHALAFFYCNRNEESRRLPENILHSLVKQLATSRPLVKVYKGKQQSGFASAKLNPDECESLFLELAQGYSQTTLIIVALDECEEKTRGDFLKRFNRLVSKSRNLKILISSRRDRDLKHQLQLRSNIGIEATDNADDISKFVSERLIQSQEDRPSPISKDLQEEIVQTLLKKSKGMFQWAALQIAEILELELESDIRDRLGRLPESLKEAYDEIFEKIKRGKGSKPAIAIRAFQWIMCSAFNPSAETLMVLVCQDPDNNNNNNKTRLSNDISIDFILDACRNLLVIALPGPASSPLPAISFFGLNNVLSEWWEDPSINPEEQYLDGNTILTLAIHGGSFNAIRRLLELGADINRQSPFQMAFLSYYHWFPKFLRLLLDAGADVNQQLECHPWGSALVAAVDFCDLEGFQTLLNSGADVNMRVRHGGFGSALAAASINKGQDSTQEMQMLLDAGADVNMQLSCGYYGSALIAASASAPQNTRKVKLLLDAGADVNMRSSCGFYGSALTAASACGNAQTVELLLDAGADVNMRMGHGDCGSALAAASAQKNTDIVQKNTDIV